MATLVRLEVVPINLDAPDHEVCADRWGVIPSDTKHAGLMFDKWVVPRDRDQINDLFPESRVVSVIGCTGDFDENHILPDGGLGPKGGS